MPSPPKELRATPASVIEAVRKEEMGTFDKAVEFGDMPDDDDEVDELDEFDMWKLRELKRVKREREERAAAERERAELERRRNLTDAERTADVAERMEAVGGGIGTLVSPTPAQQWETGAGAGAHTTKANQQK